MSIAKLSPPSSTIDLNYEIWGPTDPAGCNTETTTFALSIAGIDPPFQECDVTVTVTCTTGTASGPFTQTGITTNGSISLSGFVPECTGSLVGGPPNEAKCPDVASVTIELSCTFN